MSVLLLLAGVAAACERINPGFKLKDTSDDQGEVTSLSTSSVSGPTVTGDTSMTTTPTTSDDPTTTSEATLTASTTGAPTSETETTNDATTGMMLPWDDECGEAEIMKAEFVLLGDTFFMYADKGVGLGCDIGSGESLPNFCFNISFGASASQQVFHYPVDGVDDPFSAFAVHFKPQTINDGIDDVPPGAIIDLTLSIAFGRLDDGVDALPFLLLRMDPQNQWVEDGGDGDVCGTDDVSYRCRGCTDNMPDANCAVPWGGGMPFNADSFLVKDFMVGEADPMVPVAIALPKDELEALKGPHAGFALFPKLGLKDGVFEIKTHDLQMGTAPKLVARYCKDPNKP